jgi:hypothetical protein
VAIELFNTAHTSFNEYKSGCNITTLNSVVYLLECAAFSIAPKSPQWPQSSWKNHGDKVPVHWPSEGCPARHRFACNSFTYCSLGIAPNLTLTVMGCVLLLKLPKIRLLTIKSQGTVGWRQSWVRGRTFSSWRDLEWCRLALLYIYIRRRFIWVVIVVHYIVDRNPCSAAA